MGRMSAWNLDQCDDAGEVVVRWTGQEGGRVSSGNARAALFNDLGGEAADALISPCQHGITLIAHLSAHCLCQILFASPPPPPPGGGGKLVK